jgi:hypothetical protein
MAPRSRFLDLERDDVLFFYGAYHHHGEQPTSVAATTHTLFFWPVFPVAALLLHLAAPFPHAAAVCAGLYVACCFLLSAPRRPPPSSFAGPTAAVPSRRTAQCMTTYAGCTIEHNS